MKRSIVVAVGVMAVVFLAGVASAETMWALSYDYNGSSTSHIWQWDTATGSINQMGTVNGYMYVTSLADSGQHLYMAGYTTEWDWQLIKLNRSTMAVESVVSKSALMVDGTDRTCTAEWIDGNLYYISSGNAVEPAGQVYRMTLDAQGNIVGATAGVDMWVSENMTHSNSGYLAKNPVSEMVYAGPEGHKWQVKTADIMNGPLDPVRGYIYDELDYISSGVFDSQGEFYCADFRYGKIYTGTPDNPANASGHVSLLYDFSATLTAVGDTGFADFATPEPATMALMALGGVGLLLRRKRMK